MIVWPNKDPEEVLDYQFDWAQHRLEEGETISSSTFILESGNVVFGATDESDGITTVWISGGTLGEKCVITNRVTTSEGRTYDQSASLRIRAH